MHYWLFPNIFQDKSKVFLMIWPGPVPVDLKSMTTGKRWSHQYLTNVLTESWPQSRPNHKSYRKLYFTEFVQNSLRFNMGIIFLTSDLMEAARGQKHPSETKNGTKELIYWKKYLIKVSQKPRKSTQIWATTSG